MAMERGAQRLGVRVPGVITMLAAGMEGAMGIGRLGLSLMGAVAVVASVACSGGDSNKYPDDVRKNFMSSCTSSGGNDKQCTCALEKLEGKFSLKQFQELEKRITSGDASAESEVGPLVSACR